MRRDGPLLCSPLEPSINGAISESGTLSRIVPISRFVKVHVCDGRSDRSSFASTQALAKWRFSSREHLI
jgi:hypothetical protein